MKKLTMWEKVISGVVFCFLALALIGADKPVIWDTTNKKFIQGNGTWNSTSGQLNLSGAQPLILGGATANAYYAILDVTDPTANRTIVVPDASGTAVLSGPASNITGVKTFESFPVTPASAPTTDYQVANRKFTLDQIAAGDVDKVDSYHAASFFIESILDYGTSASASTTKNQSALHVCYGTVSVGAAGSQAITNLPFTSASTYVVELTDSAADGKNINISPTFVKNSGSQFTISNDDGDEGTLSVSWLAMGT